MIMTKDQSGIVPKSRTGMTTKIFRASLMVVHQTLINAGLALVGLVNNAGLVSIVGLTNRSHAGPINNVGLVANILSYLKKQIRHWSFQCLICFAML